MKDKILKLLKARENFVSGEDISNILGVSRTAVWKYMNSLKEEGYIIEASSKKGYRLVECADLLTSGEILPLLNTSYIGREIVHFDSIDSTNNMARKKAQEGCREGLAVISEEQTAGKGRLGRKWVTPKHKAVAFSLVLKPRIKPDEVSGITLVMGTAVCRAIRMATGLDAGIKWPNDIIVNNKKICGILTEMSAEMDAVNYIITGVGVNVNIREFPDELKDIATSISIETGEQFSRKEILSKIFTEFENLYEDFKVNRLKNILPEFRSFSVTLGKHVRVVSINESFEGQATDIGDDGLLAVKLSDGGVRKIIAGEVSVRGINGYL